jgi:hypothetical protein
MVNDPPNKTAPDPPLLYCAKCGDFRKHKYECDRVKVEAFIRFTRRTYHHEYVCVECGSVRHWGASSEPKFLGCPIRTF